jgi:aryl sulfotransferase
MSGFFWLASYPKSGNTWLRLFLESLAANGAAPDINAFGPSGDHAALRDEFDRILDIESADLTDDEIARARPRLYEIKARESNEPQPCKVHDAWELTPAGEALFPLELTLGAVYLVRDPRDVAVSFAHHMNQTPDQAIARMNDPAAVMERPRVRMPRQLPQHLCTWSAHVESWLDAPIRLLSVRYEDMLDDPVKQFGQIARFMGRDAPPEKIAAAADAVRFERLRAVEEAGGFAESPPGIERFFRRGVAGGWRDSLSHEQIARIEADHGSVMRRLGYL